MADKKESKWKKRLKKASLLLSPVEQAKFGFRVGSKAVKGIAGSKQVKSAVKGAKDFGKKVTKTAQNVNPKSEINTKINKKKAEIKDAGRGKDGKARAQLMALKRKKSGKKISEVKAENERKMRENAKKRHEAWKAKRKNKKNTKSATKIGGRGGFTG
tara:strand:+ start:64 stop:537 length:474 start_codon:yes stop_codon:yes gene_type:complete